jgi:hypothetical protein
MRRCHCESSNPIHPIPPRGAARLRWLTRLDDVIAGDVLATASRLELNGWTPGEVVWALDGYADFITARVLASVDGARLELIWPHAA